VQPIERRLSGGPGGWSARTTPAGPGSPQPASSRRKPR